MMDLYILDDENFREQFIVEKYISLIWTERFGAVGDFELVMVYSPDMHSRLTEGTYLSQSQSDRIMEISTITESRGEDGSRLVTYTGPSFERVLFERVGYSNSIVTAKSRMNSLVQDTIMWDSPRVKDRVPAMRWGVIGGDGEGLYNPSTNPPPMEPLPIEHRGYSNVGEVHDDASSGGALGYRIYRGNIRPNDPGSPVLLYDNYTGTDRTAVSEFHEPTIDWTFQNPYFLETDGDVEVFRQLLQNPGCVGNTRQLPAGDKVEEFNTGGRAVVTSIDYPTAISGKAYLIDPPEENASIHTSLYFNPFQQDLADHYDGKAWSGRTFTLTAKARLNRVQTGTLRPTARRLLVSTWDNVGGNETDIAQSNVMPNTVGNYTLSVTFSLPTRIASRARFSIRMINGSTNPGESITIYDLNMFELPALPISYMDGNYSPDSDLVPSWLGEPNESISILSGAKIAGVTPSSSCVFVQSRKWGVHQGISAKQIVIRRASSATYGLLVARNRANNFEATAYQEELYAAGTYDQTRLGSISMANTNAPSPPKPNQANTTHTSTRTQGGSGSISLGLLSGLMEPGQFMYWDVAIATPTGARRAPVLPVVFDERSDDFSSSEAFYTNSNHKNVAYVTHGKKLVEVEEIDPEDLTRRVMYVNADDLDLKGISLEREMGVIGMNALKEQRKEFMIDGKVTNMSRWTYGKDFFLGDIVLVGDLQGNLTAMRVTEYIFVNDSEGYRHYPTFTEEKASAGGTWYAPKYDTEWPTINEDWSAQP